MSVMRRQNFLGDQRVDVPHLRSMESAVAADFDLLGGTIMAGQRALVVTGFSLLSDDALGVSPTALQMAVAGGVLMHPLAAEAGTIFSVAADAALETLSISNSKVIGAFTSGAINYVGIDLRRTVDATTTDTVMFLDPASGLEIPKSVALARTLDFRIVVSTTDFSASTNVCPVAKVTTDSSGLVTAIEDARQMYFRLGSGGTTPNAGNVASWLGGRTETSTITTASTPVDGIFGAGDRTIASEKSWKDAVMTRIWEIGGGEAWYSATSDRELKLAFTSDVLASGKNADWTTVASASDSGVLTWKGLIVVFGNSRGRFNVITDGAATLEDGDCLYVDVDRTRNRNGDAGYEKLVVAKATLTALGSPIVPGSRIVIAWRKGVDVFLKDYPFDVGRSLNLPGPAGNAQNVLFEGVSGVALWRRITQADIQTTMSIASFIPGVSLHEKSENVVTPAFTASYSNFTTPTLANLVDEASVTKSVVSSPTAFTSDGTYHKETTGSNPTSLFTLTVQTTPDPSSTRTASITWTRYVYVGTSALAAPAVNAGFVTGLATSPGGSKQLNTTKSFSFTMTPTNKYIYFAFPAYYNPGAGAGGPALTITDNIGHEIAQTPAQFYYFGQISVSTENTDNGAVSENYYIYRSVNLLTGSQNWTVG